MNAVIIRGNHIIEVDSVDEYSYMKAYIDSPQEVSEFIYFVKNVKNTDLNGYGKHIVKVNEIIEAVFVVIPTKDGLKLWPYNKTSLGKLPQKIKDEVVHAISEPGMHALLPYDGFYELYEDQTLFSDIYDFLQKRGVVYSGNWGEEMKSPLDGATLQADSIFIKTNINITKDGEKKGA